MSNQLTEVQNKKAQTLVDLLQSPKMIDRFKQLATKYIEPEQMIHLAIECVRRNPTLGECDHLSILGAFVTSHSLGLKPNTIHGHAFLIPFSKWVKDDSKPKGQQWSKSQPECTFQVGYKGFSALFHRTGKVKDFAASAIRANDSYKSVIGTNPEVAFTRNLRENRGEIIASFCHINKMNGGQDLEELELDDILKIRSTSETYKFLQKALDDAKRKNNPDDIALAEKKLAETPWIKWANVMSMKPAIKRLAGRSDLDDTIAIASEADSLSDMGKMDFRAIYEAKNHDEIYDVLARQKEQASLDTPGQYDQQPIPAMDLDNMPEQPKPEKVVARNQNQTRSQNQTSDYADSF